MSAFRLFLGSSAALVTLFGVTMQCIGDDQGLTPHERELLEQWRKGTTEKGGTKETGARFLSSKEFDEELAEDKRRAESEFAKRKTRTNVQSLPVSPDRNGFDALLKAAEKGDAEAQYQLGARILSQHAERDYTRAAMWFRKAAEQGHAQAQALLASYLATGRGVKRDLREAESWWRKAAAGGSRDAMLAVWGLENKTALTDRAGRVMSIGPIMRAAPDRFFFLREDGVCCGDVALLDLPDAVQRRFGIEIVPQKPGSQMEDWQQVKLLEIKGEVGSWSRCLVRVTGGSEREALLAGLSADTKAYFQAADAYINQASALQKLETEVDVARRLYVAAVNSGSSESVRSAGGNYEEAKRQLSRMQEIYKTDMKREPFIVRARFTGRKYERIEIWDCNPARGS